MVITPKEQGVWSIPRERAPADTATWEAPSTFLHRKGPPPLLLTWQGTTAFSPLPTPQVGLKCPQQVAGVSGHLALPHRAGF